MSKPILSMNKKAQAAMEFLMTYGWAILVVLVVIGALAYFGVLSPATLLPEKCTFPVSLSCTDHTVERTQIRLVLQNGAGRDMQISRITAASEAFGGGNPPNLGCGCSFIPAAPVTLRNGQTRNFDLNVRDEVGACSLGAFCTYRDTGRDKNRYNITIVYNWLDSPTIVHQLPGELLARRS